MSHFKNPLLLSKEFKQRFWAKIKMGSENECWEWYGSLGGGGYGRMKLPRSRHNESAHRISYFLATGIDPTGHVVQHKCDNRRCCNPKHLTLGTHASNMADMAEKGRANNGIQHGENNNNAKLTRRDVDEIRALIISGETNVSVAKKYNVTHSMISRIRNGKSWN